MYNYQNLSICVMYTADKHFRAAKVHGDSNSPDRPDSGGGVSASVLHTQLCHGIAGTDDLVSQCHPADALPHAPQSAQI